MITVDTSRRFVAWMSSLVAVLALAACGADNSANVPTTRPGNVPAEAKYAGGADGGVYVTVEHRAGSDYYIQVYLDAGYLAYKGPATLSEFSAARTVTAADISGWDGEVLLLSPDGVLTPTEPIPAIDSGQK